MGSKPRRGSDRTCERDGCDVVFYARASSSRRFCSRSCKDLAARAGVERTCPVCDGRFYKPVNDPDLWCSRSCYDRGRREAAVGRRKLTPDGYAVVFLPGHSEAQASGWANEHRVVMAEMLGRPLLPTENVHHRNGSRSDNRPENLELWVSAQPSGQRPEDLLAFARAISEQYGDVEWNRGAPTVPTV